MPQELEALYSTMDGITVTVASNSSGPNDYPDMFLLRTLDRMIEESASRIWSFFEYAGEVDEAERQRFNMKRALELCDFAYFDDDAELCLIDLALSSEKCTIIDTSYEDDLFPEQLPCVAQSLESFIDQCFENRRNGGPGQGFRYFWPKFGASPRN
jgi:hypothetical protein